MAVFVNEKVVQKGSKKLSTLSTDVIGSRSGNKGLPRSPNAQFLKPF